MTTVAASENNRRHHAVMRPDQYAKIYQTCLEIDEIINTLSVRLYEHCSDTTAKWSNQSSVDSYCRFFLTFESDCSVFCNEEEIPLEPGAIHFLPAQLPLRLPVNEGVRLYFQHFHIAALSGVDLWYVLKPQPVILRDVPENIISKFVDYTRNLPDTLAGQMALLALTYDLLARVFAEGDFQLRAQSRRSVARIGKALHVMELHPQRVFPVAELAQLCAMSRENFTREFTLVTGMPPAHYQQERRMGLIRELLLKGDDKLQAIADAFGFSSAYHLSAAFKRYSGMSPREFRMKNQFR